MDKRAITPGIVAIIAVLIAGLMLFLFQAEIFDRVSELEDNSLAKCRLIIGARHLEEKITQDFGDIIESQCVTSTFSIDTDDLNTPDNLNKYFADMIGEVWHTVYAGKIGKNLWEDNPILIFNSQGAEEQCVLLATIDLNGELDEEYQTTSENFQSYLQDTVFFEEDGISWTYADYIQFYGPRVQGAELPGALYSPEEFTFQGDTSYAVAISSYQEDWLQQGLNFFVSESGENQYSNTLWFGERDTLVQQGCRMQGVVDE